MFVNLSAAPVALASPGTVTISAASPAVVSKTAHGLLDGTPLSFTAGTSVPAGMVSGQTYYVKLDDPVDADSFSLTRTQFATDYVVTTDVGVGTITATATNVVATINTESVRTMGLEVKNVGANPLDLFSIFGKMTPTGNEIALSALASDYTTPVYPVTKASASPVLLAASATVWLFMDVTGLAQVVLKASSSTGATSLEIHASTKFMV